MEETQEIEMQAVEDWTDDPERNKYPYLKPPSHLTSKEFWRISELSLTFHEMQDTFEDMNECRLVVKEGKQRQVVEQQKDLRLLDEKLAELEKSLISTRDPKRCKIYEEDCKETRAQMVEGRNRFAELEREIKLIEGASPALADEMQLTVMMAARALVRTYRKARRRHDRDHRAGGGADRE